MVNVGPTTFCANIVRVCPDFASGERLNIGVVLTCAGSGFADALFLTDWSRVLAAFPGVRAERLEAATQRFAQALGETRGDRHATDVLCAAFGNEPGILAVSEPISGVADDCDSMLRDIFRMYVSPTQALDSRSRPTSTTVTEPMLMAA